MKEADIGKLGNEGGEPLLFAVLLFDDQLFGVQRDPLNLVPGQLFVAFGDILLGEA